MRTLLLLAGLSMTGCASTPVDPRSVPMERVRAGRQDVVREIVEGDPLEVVIPRTPVHSRLEVYDFLLEELPFTAGVLRALGTSNYLIFRDEPAAGEGPEMREIRRRTYHLSDQEGMDLAAELIYREKAKWVYYVWGKYSSVFGDIHGKSVIVVTAHRNGDALETEAHVFTPITKTAGPIVARIIRQKSSIFIDAARTVAEATTRDPRALLRNIRGSPEVDEKVLAEFERRFVR